MKELVEMLATRGGRIAVLSGFAFLLIGVSASFAYLPPAHDKASESILMLVGLVVGALLTSLRGNLPKGGK